MSNLSRRRFIEGAGAATAAALAGCTGEDDSQATTANGGDQQFSDVSFKYWGTIHANSRAARLKTELLISQFESSTGATIEPSWDGFLDVGSKWANAFQQGEYPTFYDSNGPFMGYAIRDGWVKPFDTYRDRFDDSVLNDVEWFLPKMENSFIGFDEHDVYELPFSANALDPFVARMDHFEEAGLDPAEDFPPQDYEHLVEVATTLQEEGPGDYGFQIHGAGGDVLDELQPTWQIADGGKEGLFLTDDWSDTRLDNDVWKEWTRKMIEVYTEHGLSNPETPNFDDEQTASLMAQGSVSMSQVNTLNHPVFLEQAGSLMQDGTIQYAPMWPGQADQRGYIFPYLMGVTNQPENADEQMWQRKVDAAIEFYQMWFDEGFQRETFVDYGTTPLRQSVWDDLAGGGEHNILDVATQMIESTELSAESHPQITAIMYGDATAVMQQALRGEITPNEANEQAAEIIREVL